jgi:hypothetical protein
MSQPSSRSARGDDKDSLQTLIRCYRRIPRDKCGRVKGQDLPELLSGCGQKVYKSIRFMSQIADAVCGRKEVMCIKIPLGRDLITRLSRYAAVENVVHSIAGFFPAHLLLKPEEIQLCVPALSQSKNDGSFSADSFNIRRMVQDVKETGHALS